MLAAGEAITAAGRRVQYCNLHGVITITTPARGLRAAATAYYVVRGGS